MRNHMSFQRLRDRSEPQRHAYTLGLIHSFLVSDELVVGVRPEHLLPSERGLRVRVEACEILGAETIVHSNLQSGERLVASLRGIHRFAEGQVLGFEIDRRFLHVFGADGRTIAPTLDRAREFSS